MYLPFSMDGPYGCFQVLVGKVGSWPPLPGMECRVLRASRSLLITNARPDEGNAEEESPTQTGELI